MYNNSLTRTLRIKDNAKNIPHLIVQTNDKRHAHNRSQPEQSPVEVCKIVAGVHALGNRISLILDSQKRRESASLKGREGKRPPSKNLFLPSPAAMAT
jgi:hypothetical protein